MPPQSTPVKPSQHVLMLWLQALLKESLIERAADDGVPEGLLLHGILQFQCALLLPTCPHGSWGGIHFDLQSKECKHLPFRADDITGDFTVADKLGWGLAMKRESECFPLLSLKVGPPSCLVA